MWTDFHLRFRNWYNLEHSIAQLQYAATSFQKLRCNLVASGEEKHHKADHCQDTVQEEGLFGLRKIMMQHIAALSTVPMLRGSLPYLKQNWKWCFCPCFFQVLWLSLAPTCCCVTCPCQDAKCVHKISKTKTSMGCMMVFGLLYLTKLIKALENVFVSSISLTKCSK